MTLLQVRRATFTVAAIARDSRKCDLVDFLTGARSRRPSDFRGIYDVFERAAASGRPAESEHCRSLGNSLWEFRHGDIRVLWFVDPDEGTILLCTHGYWNKSRKTPQGEIDKAHTRRLAYFKAKAAGHLVRDWEAQRA